MKRRHLGLLMIVIGSLLSLYTYPLIGVKNPDSLISKLKDGQKVRIIGNAYEVGHRDIPFVSDILLTTDAKILKLEKFRNILVYTSNIDARNYKKVLIKGYVLKLPFSDITMITGERVENLAQSIFNKKKLRPATVKKIPGLDFYFSVMLTLFGFILIII